MPECLTSLLDSSDANKVWSWLPCGVACSAGELVELQSTLAGTTWTTASTNLAATSCGGGLVRSGSQYVLTDLAGRVAQSRDSSGTLVASATYDVYGVQRAGTGVFAAGIIRKTYGGNNEDGVSSFLKGRGGKHEWTVRPPVYIYPQWPILDDRIGPSWGYGNYCGKDRVGVAGPFEGQRPLDAVDSCCQKHDSATYGKWFPTQTNRADCDLVECIMKADCKGDAVCLKAKIEWAPSL